LLLDRPERALDVPDVGLVEDGGGGSLELLARDLVGA
jgi:hypothetical protein